MNNGIKSFTQSTTLTAHLLIEVEDELFFQLTETDEMDTFYANTLSLELDVNQNVATQLVATLHANGMELQKYRELLRETHTHYSYASDTPGTSRDVVVLHVVVEQTERTIPHTLDQSVEYVALDKYMENLRATGMPPGLMEASVSRLLLERSLSHEEVS